MSKCMAFAGALSVIIITAGSALADSVVIIENGRERTMLGNIDKDSINGISVRTADGAIITHNLDIVVRVVYDNRPPDWDFLLLSYNNENNTPGDYKSLYTRFRRVRLPDDSKLKQYREYYMAMCRFKGGEYPKSITAFQSILGKTPNSHFRNHIYFYKAKAELASGNTTAAGRTASILARVRGKWAAAGILMQGYAASNTNAKKRFFSKAASHASADDAIKGEACLQMAALSKGPEMVEWGIKATSVNLPKALARKAYMLIGKGLSNSSSSKDLRESAMAFLHVAELYSANRDQQSEARIAAAKSLAKIKDSDTEKERKLHALGRRLLKQCITENRNSKYATEAGKLLRQ